MNFKRVVGEQFHAGSTLVVSECMKNEGLGGFHFARQILLQLTGLGFMRIVIIKQLMEIKAILRT